MPKVVDHEQRRRHIAAAVCRVAAAEGLEAVSVRRVASEAGLSAAVVQFHFPDKASMLLFAINDLTATAERTAQDRIAATVEARAGRLTPALVRAILTELLPLDDDRRTFLLVHQAYFSRAMFDPEVASIYRDQSPRLVEYLASELQREQQAGSVPADLDPRREAQTLVALVLELGIEMLMELQTAETAVGLLDYHLGRIFPAQSATTRRDDAGSPAPAG